MRKLPIKLTALLITFSLLNMVGFITSVEEGASQNWVVINFDGDVSSSIFEDGEYWNPHVFGFTEKTEWNVTFSDRVLVVLKTGWGESGHLATGMWWTAGFKEGKKIALHGRDVRVDFDIKVAKFSYGGPNDWLRIALACAIQRGDGSVVYTEVDFMDSPSTLLHPKGNIPLGGDIIYQQGDVVEFKIDEASVDVWKHYRIDLTRYIERAWKIKQGDHLESVYIVIESDGVPVEVQLEIDNFWVRASLK